LSLVTGFASSVDSVGEALGVECSFRLVARNHVTHTKTAQHMFQTVSIPFWLNKRWSRLVAEQIWCPLRKAGYGKNFATIAGVRQFHPPGSLERETMDECVYCRLRRGDSGLVPSELSISGMERCPRRSYGAKWNTVLLLLGCGLFVSACAHDSADDDTGGAHRHHRHGDEHGREQTETIDRSSNPSPTPALGW
jgi:hypothetical protein